MNINNFMLKPKCHKGRGIAYVSTGHLLPCCWCDTIHPKAKQQFVDLGFFYEDLKLENNDTISRVKSDSFSKSLTAIYILQSSLDFNQGGEIAENLNKIYEFCRTTIIKSFSKSYKNII